MTIRTFRSCVVIVFSAIAGLAGSASAQATHEVAFPVDFAGGVTNHVIVVSIDGLRPDAIDEFGAETLQRLMRGGSYSLAASTIMPSKTLPSHTSMLTGVGPEVHGILWNSHDEDLLGYVEVPTIFELADGAGLSTAAFASKAKFRHLLDPEYVDYFEAPVGNAVTFMATRTVERAVTYLRHRRPHLLFVHFGEPDFAGHTAGWMSPVYGWAVRQADAALARLLETADQVYGAGEYMVLVTSDHGGHARTHGTADPTDRVIPWIVYGEGVRSNAELLPGIRTMDTAATVLWALGVGVPNDWAGRPVVTAFEVSRAPAVTTAGATP